MGTLPLDHEDSTRPRIQHKNANTAEAPDSEQKTSDMQHKAPFLTLDQRVEVY